MIFFLNSIFVGSKNIQKYSQKSTFLVSEGSSNNYS